MIKISWETLLKSEMCEGLSLNVDMFWDEGKNVNFLKASNYKLLAKRLEIGAKKGNMKIVDTKLTQYGDKNPDYGFTYLVVLGQSHIVIHTWPEERLMNLDAFTCGEEGSPVKIVHYIRESFKPDDFVVKQNKRGIRSHVKSVDEKLDKPKDLKVKKMKKENMTQKQMEQALGTFEQFALESGNSELANLAKKTIVEYSRIMESMNKSEWWDSLKAGGAVNTATPGIYNQSIKQPPKEEEEVYEIIPDEKDFWRD